MSDEKSGIKYPIMSWYWVVGTLTAIIGYHMHKSIGWAILDWLFPAVTWTKWLFLHEVSWRIIQDTFSFFWK